MCLSKIEVAYDKPSDLIVDGWKAFIGTGPKLTLSYMGSVALDTWLTASAANAPNGIKGDDGKTYKAGFHAYIDSPRYSGYRRVYLRKITCAGEQDGKKCVIAQEMYVPSDPNGWPPKAKKKLVDRIRKR